METERIENFSRLVHRLCRILQTPFAHKFIMEVFPLRPTTTGYYHVDVQHAVTAKAVMKINQIVDTSSRHLTATKAHRILLKAFPQVTFRAVPRALLPLLAASHEDRDRHLYDLMSQSDIQESVTVQFNTVKCIDPVDSLPIYWSFPVILQMVPNESHVDSRSWTEELDRLQVGTTLVREMRDRGIFGDAGNKDILTLMREKCALCHVTKNTHKLMICKGCKSTAYCDIQCQKRDWGRHRHVCQVRRDIAQNVSLYL